MSKVKTKRRKANGEGLLKTILIQNCILSGKQGVFWEMYKWRILGFFVVGCDSQKTEKGDLFLAFDNSPKTG